MKRPKDILKTAALTLALVATASAEYELARAIGMHPLLAATVPGALDVYSIRAFRMHRDVLVSTGALIATNALSHLLSAGLIHVSTALVIAVSAIPPLVLARISAMRPKDEAKKAPEKPSAPAVAPQKPAPAPELPPAPEKPAESRAEIPAPASAPSTKTAPAPESAPKPVPTAPVTDELLPSAREFDASTRASTGKPASLRALRSEYTIGQARAQRIRAALDSEYVPA